MAIEIVSFPIKNGGSFHSYVSLPEGNPPKDGGFILHPPSCKDVPSSPRCARASKGCSPWSDRSGSTSPGGRSAGWHVVGYYSWWTHTYIHIYIYIYIYYMFLLYYNILYTVHHILTVSKSFDIFCWMMFGYNLPPVLVAYYPDVSQESQRLKKIENRP